MSILTVKKIRFNYFNVRLSITDHQGVVNSAPWDMTDFFNYISVTTNQIDGVVNVGEYNAELDRNTFLHEINPQLFSIQISKLRDDKLPVIKAIGIEKEDLNLNENQYLGEYITIIYDPQLYILAVQSNLYSLNIKQLEVMLTNLRLNYFNAIGEPQDPPFEVSLNPILDPNKVNQVREAEIFKKISIKGSEVNVEAFEDNPTLNGLSAVIGQIEGVNFELTLSVGQGPRDRSLNREVVQEIIDSYNAYDGPKPKVEVKAADDNESRPEIINLLTPRVTNLISLNFPSRQSIGHEMIFNNFKEEYLESIRNIIFRVVPVPR